MLRIRSTFVVLLAAFFSSSILSRVTAGPNAGGYLLVHTDDSVTYTLEQDYVGGSGLECPQDWDCPPYSDPGCATQICLADPTSDRGDRVAVWWVLLAFPEEVSCPEVKGVTFGLDYEASEVHLVDWGTSAGAELHDPEWPDPNSGTAIVFSSPRVTPVMEIYWFAAWAPYGESEVSLIPHPRQGGGIADDSIPANIDPIAGYGELGLGGASGSNTGCYNSIPVLETSWGEIKASFH